MLLLDKDKKSNHHLKWIFFCDLKHVSFANMQKTKKSERELVLQNKKRHINQHMNAASSSPEGP